MSHEPLCDETKYTNRTLMFWRELGIVYVDWFTSRSSLASRIVFFSALTKNRLQRLHLIELNLHAEAAHASARPQHQQPQPWTATANSST